MACHLMAVVIMHVHKYEIEGNIKYDHIVVFFTSGDLFIPGSVLQAYPRPLTVGSGNSLFLVHYHGE